MQRRATPPPARIRVLVPRLPAARVLLPYLARIDENRVYSNFGPLHREFAARLGQLTAAPGVALTCNGTAAIELALRAYATPGRRLCIMPAFTFIATAHAVSNAGLTPYLVDIDPESLELTPAIAAEAIESLQELPAAVVVVSAFGAPPELGAWSRFETEHGVPVVFDAAAAVTSLHGVGRQPLCVSLHATKVLGIGEGGAVLSTDEDVTGTVQSMTGFGFTGSERVSMVRGGNYRMSEYSAAIGLAAFDELPQRLVVLRAVTRGYRARLEGKATRLQPGVGETWDTMTLNAILPADEVGPTLSRFDADEIEWRRWWGPGTHLHPAFAGLPRTALPSTEAMAPRVIGVPFHDLLTEAELDRVASCLE